MNSMTHSTSLFALMHALFSVAGLIACWRLCVLTQRDTDQARRDAEQARRDSAETREHFTARMDRLWTRIVQRDDRDTEMKLRILRLERARENAIRPVVRLDPPKD